MNLKIQIQNFLKMMDPDLRYQVHNEYGSASLIFILQYID